MEVRIRAILISIAFSLTACLKEEIPIERPDPGEVETAQVTLFSDYRYQVYFDLNTGQEIAKNLKTDWDIGFECGLEGKHVILNSSKLMFAADSRKNDPTISDTNGNYTWLTDGVGGDLDSTALYTWENGNVFLIDRGFDERGRHLGVYKLRISDATEQTYSISYAPINESTFITAVVEKNDALNFVYFTFDNNGEQLALEPIKTDWDLCFTRYTEKLFDGEGYIPYLVTGVLINRYQTLATFRADKSFDEITIEDAMNADLSRRIDGIGYRWKLFDFDLSVYTVYPEYSYIVKNRSGFFYKLRFIDFYNERGESGSPKFEFQQL